MKNNITIDMLKIAWRGQEEQILRSLGGLTSKNLSGKHQPCPVHNGTDRYRAIKKNGVLTGGYFCGSDNTGDLIDHLAHVRGWTTAETLKELKDFLGMSKVTANERQELQKKRNKELAESEFKLKVREYNRKEDDDIQWMLDDLSITMKQRGYERLPTADEKEIAYKLVAMIVKRYLGLDAVRGSFMEAWRSIKNI